MGFVHSRGLFEVTYAVEQDMLPERQDALVKALEAAVAQGPVALLITVKQASGVPAAVPAFWMEVTKKLCPKLCAMAIVSPSIAVRTAARGFGVANKLRRVELAVAPFDAEAAGRTWVDAQLAAASSPAAA